MGRELDDAVILGLIKNSGGGGGSYHLPTASASVKGGVKIGTGLSMDGDVLNVTGGGGGGTTNYNELSNQPQINDVTLIGNKSLSDLGFGDLAEKDNASGSYTPEGTVTPSVTGTQTATVNSITSVGVLPTVSYSDGGIVFNAGTLPTKGADQTVVSDIGTVSATFSGTAKAVTVS